MSVYLLIRSLQMSADSVSFSQSHPITFVSNHQPPICMIKPELLPLLVYFKFHWKNVWLKGNHRMH